MFCDTWGFPQFKKVQNVHNILELSLVWNLDEKFHYVQDEISWKAFSYLYLFVIYGEFYILWEEKVDSIFNTEGDDVRNQIFFLQQFSHSATAAFIE